MTEAFPPSTHDEAVHAFTVALRELRGLGGILTSSKIAQVPKFIHLLGVDTADDAWISFGRSIDVLRDLFPQSPLGDQVRAATMALGYAGRTGEPIPVTSADAIRAVRTEFATSERTAWRMVSDGIDIVANYLAIRTFSAISGIGLETEVGRRRLSLVVKLRAHFVNPISDATFTARFLDHEETAGTIKFKTLGELPDGFRIWESAELTFEFPEQIVDSYVGVVFEVGIETNFDMRVMNSITCNSLAPGLSVCMGGNKGKVVLSVFQGDVAPFREPL